MFSTANEKYNINAVKLDSTRYERCSVVLGVKRAIVNGQYTRPRRLHTFLHSKYTTSCCSHTPHGRGPSMDNTRDCVDYMPSCTPSTPRRVAPTLLMAEDVHLCNLTEIYSCIDYIPSCTPSTPRRVAPTLLMAEDVHLCNLTEIYSCIGPHDSVNGQYTRPRRLHTFLHSKYTTSCCSHTPHGRAPSMDNTRDRVDYIHTFLHSKYTTSCCSYTPHGRGRALV
ncbi:hypothetical protein J6590_050649 [Homalodisca vitripennis]|nr:hypothetical protein J6590_050649 [Homalodisca vitripennis]